MANFDVLGDALNCVLFEHKARQCLHAYTDKCETDLICTSGHRRRLLYVPCCMLGLRTDCGSVLQEGLCNQQPRPVPHHSCFDACDDAVVLVCLADGPIGKFCMANRILWDLILLGQYDDAV